VSVCLLGDRMSWLTLRSDDGEGCEGNEGSIEVGGLQYYFQLENWYLD
jgi:hypothetical protein